MWLNEKEKEKNLHIRDVVEMSIYFTEIYLLSYLLHACAEFHPYG